MGRARVARPPSVARGGSRRLLIRDADLERLLDEGQSLPLKGWSFEPVRGRFATRPPPWDLKRLVLEAWRPGGTLLDLGTGGGEFLSTFAPFPGPTLATESYAPNLAVARSRLSPRGAHVLTVEDLRHLPVPSAAVDTVMDRHEAFDPIEVARVLRPGGRFLTQQVGVENGHELLDRFQVPGEAPFNQLDSAEALAEEVSRGGLEVLRAEESRREETFSDVGAIVFYLRMAPWEVPDFTVARYRPVLEAIHREIVEGGPFRTTAHRILVVARRPR